MLTPSRTHAVFACTLYVKIDQFRSADDFDSFSAFCTEIVGNPIQFDRERMRLTYASKRLGALYIDIHGGRTLDGEPADLDYPAQGFLYITGIVSIERTGRGVYNIIYTGVIP